MKYDFDDKNNKKKQSFPLFVETKEALRPSLTSDPDNSKMDSEDNKEINQEQLLLESSSNKSNILNEVTFDNDIILDEDKMLDVNSSFIVTELESTLSRLQSL